MQTLDISSKKFMALKELEIGKGITNTEAILYLFPMKKDWETKVYILKKFFVTEGKNFGNKLDTVYTLLENKDKINIDEMILPEKVVSIDHDICGFLMPYVPNINLGVILNSFDYSNDIKIEYLKQIGNILDKMKRRREFGIIKDFYINDLHEANFILNIATGKINVVDLDSCKIGKNDAFPSKYLYLNKNIENINKYRKYNFECGGNIIPDENTEIFCYISIIFKYLLRVNLSDLSISEYYDYLEYLNNLGVSDKLCEIFSYIYLNKNNENPVEYLDELKNLDGRTFYNVYKRLRKK